jgi:adenylate cyclase
MGKEIERKYLIELTKWQQVSKPKGALYRQGYLLTDPDKTIRVRLTETAGYLTIKGATVNTTRSEYEYEIPASEAKELLDRFSVSELSKTRYRIDHRGKVWEVDEFFGDNEGLVVAEIELTTEDEEFDIPGWIGKEVTGDAKYYNSSLTMNPYNKWEPE